MATYAAYRHIELDNIGYGKKRVLKPPGGGSSDIFGAGPGSEQNLEPRRSKINQNASNLFLGTDDEALNCKGASKAGNDSHQRLFGSEASDPPRTPSVKDRMKSNIIMNDDLSGTVYVNNSTVDKLVLDANGNGLSPGQSPSASPPTSPRNGNYSSGSYSPRNPVTGLGIGEAPVRQTNYGRRKDGNPVTGEGYDVIAPPKPPTPQMSNGGTTPSTPNSTSSSVGPRQRVPPGGFSSGLW